MDYELSTMNSRVPLPRSVPSVPLWLLLPLLLLVTTPTSAEYAVLRSGQRIRITGYQRVDCRLQAEGAPTQSTQATSTSTSLSASLCYVMHMRGGRLEVPAADVLAIEPEDAFGPAAAPMPRTPYDTIITAAALRHRLDEKLISSVIAAESNFNPRAISPRNARGLMQLMPDTARRLGVTDIFDPEQNINAGTRYLRELLDRYDGDLTLALAAYNAGPERITQYRGVPPFPETRAYLSRIAARLRDSSAPGAPAPTIAAQ